MNAARAAQGEAPHRFPRETALGAMLHFMANASADSYAPTAFNLAMLPPVPGGRGKRSRKEALLERARAALAAFIQDTAAR